MTQEQKDILIKDLHARLPYDTCVYVAVNTVNGLEWYWEKLTKQLLIQIEEEDAWEYIKPLLRPMSNMTEENYRPLETRLKKYNLNLNEESAWVEIDYLLAHYFDYRGLIPMGLAIAVTEKNNPYKD